LKSQIVTTGRGRSRSNLYIFIIWGKITLIIHKLISLSQIPDIPDVSELVEAAEKNGTIRFFCKHMFNHEDWEFKNFVFPIFEKVFFDKSILDWICRFEDDAEFSAAIFKIADKTRDSLNLSSSMLEEEFKIAFINFFEAYLKRIGITFIKPDDYNN
jgi:hypothetical protein